MSYARGARNVVNRLIEFDVMKKILLLSIVTICALCVSGQTKEDLKKQREQIIKFHECFYNQMAFPERYEPTVTLSTGKTIHMLSKIDYKRSAFVSVDKLMEDVREWEQSPYLWQLKHQKNNRAIMDGRDLSDWEIDSFDQIARSYFKDCNSTFHIASHGLLDGTGTVGDGILIDGQILNAAETAELIHQLMDTSFHHIINTENQPFTVVVHSCHSAEGENNFAAQLSKELAKKIPNVAVVGAPDVVYCKMEDGKYTEFVTSQEEAKRENPRNQKWQVYKNGENTGQGQYDYRETVSLIQKMHQAEQ